MKKRILLTLTILLLALYPLANRITLYAQQSSCSISDIQEIKFVTNSDNKYEFYISSLATMPDMKFQIDLGNFDESTKKCLAENLKDKFNYNLKVEYWDGGAEGQHKILETKLGAQRSGLSTNDGWELSFNNKSNNLEIKSEEFGNTFGGGTVGSVRASVDINGKVLTAQSPLYVWAAPSDKTEIKLALGDLKYQLLGYLESKFIQVYNGIPLLNCGNSTCSESDGGYGLMQLTDCSGAEGTLRSISSKDDDYSHGFPSYRQIWDWKANVAGGKSCYDIKVDYFCTDLPAGSDEQLECGYSAYNGSDSYGDLGIAILNEMRDGRFRSGWF